LDSSGSAQGPGTGSCQYNSKPAGSMKGAEFIGQLTDYQLLKDSS